MLTQTKHFKAQITKQFIGIMVVIIIGVAVVIPVVNSVITTANLTGTTKTLVELLPLFIAIALILVVTKLRVSQSIHFAISRNVLMREQNSIEGG